MYPISYFYPEGHQAHFSPGHPERPERVETIRVALDDMGWWQPYPKLEPILLPDEVLHMVHSPEYLSLLKMTSCRGGHLDADTYVVPASWQLALHAAGGAAAVATSVWRRESCRGFALCRPPGHHAMRGQGMGFCLLNNIALATENLVQSEGARRLAIIDFDLHHGNGTEDIFWRRGDVMFISLHQSPLYPFSGKLWQTGEGPGQHTTANFPLLPGSGDQAFLTILDELLLPLLDRFAPEMILISYGFDHHWLDPLGNLFLSAETVHKLMAKLSRWADIHCQGRLALVLEGGYHLDAAKVCSQAIVSSLLEQPWSDPLGFAPEAESMAWHRMLAEALKLWH